MQTIQRKFSTLNGIRFSYLEQGGGEPFVMLHGLMSNAWDFGFQFERFSGAMRCLAPDMRGCGLTHAPDPARVTLEQAVADAEAFIESVAPGGKVILMGHSFGGVVATELLARCPERLHRAVIVAAPAEKLGNPIMKLALPLYRAAAVPLLNKSLIHFYALNVNVDPANVTPEIEQLLRMRNRFISRHDALAMGAYFESMIDHRIPDLSAAAGVPVLMVFGAQDLLVTEKSGALLEKFLPGARRVTIRNSRHSPMYEQPEEFNKILESFLNG
jgi:pimeloyl-ACP methyl ester carboxylesterase